MKKHSEDKVLDKDYPIAKPTIETVVGEFLADATAAPGETEEDKENVLDLFIECINSYGHQFLAPKELETLDHYESLTGDKRLIFCQVFGPDRVPINAAVFVGYYMIASILLDGEEMAGCANVVVAFCRWLGEKNYLPQDIASKAVERASRVGAVLAQSDRANKLIHKYAETPPAHLDEYLESAYWSINRIESDSLWLMGEDGVEYGPVALPEGAALLLRVKWTICSALAKSGDTWHFSEVGNFYPDEDRNEYVAKK